MNGFETLTKLANEITENSIQELNQKMDYASSRFHKTIELIMANKLDEARAVLAEDWTRCRSGERS